MATLMEAHESWPGQDADWQGLTIQVGKSDECHNGRDWEGFEYTIYRKGTDILVAFSNADTIDDIQNALTDVCGIPASFDGWYWIDYSGRIRVTGE